MQAGMFMPGAGRKVVQTELDQKEYENILSLSKSKGITIKEATREALRLWAASASDLSKDSLFNLRPVEFKVKIKSDEMEAFLYKRR